MGGIGSGRKPLRDEEKRQRILEKAWDLVSEKLNSSDTRRFELAGSMVIKDITSHVEGKGIGSTQYLIIRNDKSKAEDAQLPTGQIPIQQR